MSIFYWILEKVLGIAGFIIRLFPVADLTDSWAILRSGQEFIRTVGLLNDYVPIVEVLAGIGLCLSTLGILYGVMVVRRTFSLVWPGAGS